MFNKAIHYMTSFYDGVLAWGFITVSLHELSGTQITIVTLVVLSLSGVAISMFLLLLTEYRLDQSFWLMC